MHASQQTRLPIASSGAAEKERAGAKYVETSSGGIAGAGAAGHDCRLLSDRWSAGNSG